MTELKEIDPGERPCIMDCPGGYCFFWREVGTPVDMTGPFYDSHADALDALPGTRITRAGCACSSPDPCRRASGRLTDSDHHEPREPHLHRDGLPALFFCNPFDLTEEALPTYQEMSRTLWPEQHTLYEDPEQVLIFDLVLDAITSWDPMGLIALGCPPQEYDLEAKKIVERFEEFTSATQVARVIAEVFCAMFNEERFTTARCIGVAGELLDTLRKEHLITHVHSGAK